MCIYVYSSRLELLPKGTFYGFQQLRGYIRLFTVFLSNRVGMNIPSSVAAVDPDVRGSTGDTLFIPTGLVICGPVGNQEKKRLQTFHTCIDFASTFQTERSLRPTNAQPAFEPGIMCVPARGPEVAV